MEHLIEAVIKDDVAQVQQLLDSGLDPNGWEDTAQVRPLHYAAQHNSWASAKVLIKAGAMVDARTADGITPLEVAKLHSGPDMVELLKTGNHPRGAS